MGWWADDVSDKHWLGPVVVVSFALLLFILGQMVTTRVSFDILEFCKPEGIKDSAKNSWTNIGVTAALLVTMVAAMLQVDAMDPSGFKLNDWESKELIDLQQTYVSLCAASLLFLMMSIMYCVLHISYVDPLDTKNSIKFFLKCPDSLGDPIVFLGEGCVMMYAAMVVWVWGTHGALQGIIMCVAAVAFVVMVVIQWLIKSNFNPEILDFSWTQEEPSKWPTKYGVGPTDMPPQYRMRRNDTKIREMLRKLGKAVLDENKEQQKC